MWNELICVGESGACGGLGVFAKKVIAPLTFLTEYPGVRIQIDGEDVSSSADNKKKQPQPQPQRLTSLKKLCYLATGHDGRYVLDPTDERGGLLPQYGDHPGPRFNEPPPGGSLNAVFVSNHQTQRLEIWTLTTILPQQEIYLFYGDKYPRDYLLSSSLFRHRNLSFAISERRGTLEAIILNDNTLFPEELITKLHCSNHFLNHLSLQSKNAKQEDEEQEELESILPSFLVPLANWFSEQQTTNNKQQQR